MKFDDLKKQIIKEAENDERTQPGYYSMPEMNDACFLKELNSIVIKKFYNQFVSLNIVHDKEQPLIQYFEPNKVGNDFVVGDIHNQFNQLTKQLTEINFNTERDRLFAAGDLVDRGRKKDNNGFLAANFLKEKWFYSVMGNHEDMILSILSMPDKWNEIVYKMSHSNGGGWILNNSTEIGKEL